MYLDVGLTVMGSNIRRNALKYAPYNHYLLQPLT